MSLVFFDTEGRGPDLPTIGTLNWWLDARTELTMISWGIDDGMIKLWVPDFSARLHPVVWAYIKNHVHDWGPLPLQLKLAAANPLDYWVAWNAGFDRAGLTQIGPDYGFPAMGIGRFLCAQAQAQASNLPGSLEMAGRAFDLGEKTVGGKAVMKRFADPDLPIPGALELFEGLTVEETDIALALALEQWDLYLTYGGQDTSLMRDIWNATRPLDETEWREYWAHERINDRGMMVDTEFAAAAVKYKDEEEAYVIERCKELTNGAIQGPTFSAKITAWVYERLSEELNAVMVKERDAITKEPIRFTLDKATITRLLEDIEWCEVPPEDNVVELLELLQYGRSTSASKFQKILDQAVQTDDGPRLTYSYTFNGAGQTGRFSSRGVQIHNLINKPMLNELDVMDLIISGAPIEELRKLPLDKEQAKKNNRPPTAVSAILGRLIRPTFIAPPDKVLVWCDWAAVEARVNPWLANSRAAREQVLQLFENGEDIYCANAEAIFHLPAEEIKARYKADDQQAVAWRQAGKISVLSLGFLGGAGAYRAMARNYGVRASNEEAQLVVDGWRSRNTWARAFGDQANLAAFHAMNHPGTAYKAGLLEIIYHKDLMGGTLVTFLPDGRPICYPMARIVMQERFGKDQETITYLNGNGRHSMWSGKLIQGPTQGYAASLLRSTLLEIDETWEPEMGVVVGDTHDEIIMEVHQDQADDTAKALKALMERGFQHSTGLPLKAEVKTDWYYHK